MSEKLKRYNVGIFNYDGIYEATYYEDEHGNFLLASDVAELEAELTDALRCEQLAVSNTAALKARVEELLAERDAAKKIIEAYELDHEWVVVRGEKCAMQIAEEEAAAALKALEVAMRRIASCEHMLACYRVGRRPSEMALDTARDTSDAVDADPLCAATLERIRKEPPHP